MISQEAFEIFYDISDYCCVLSTPQQFESFKKIIEQYSEIVDWDFKGYEPEIMYPIVVTFRVRTFPNEIVYVLFSSKDTESGKQDLDNYQIVEPQKIITWAKQIHDIEKKAREDYNKKNTQKKIKNRIFAKIDDQKKGKELYDLASAAGYEVYPNYYDEDDTRSVEIVKHKGEFTFNFSDANVYQKSEKDDGKLIDIDTIIPIVKKVAEKTASLNKEKPFGNYLFLGNNPFGDDANKWIKKQQRALNKLEPNTPKEKELADILKRWVGTGYSGQKVGPDLYKFKDDIKKFKSIFPSILHTKLKPGTRVYRGVINLTEKTAKLLSTKTTPEDFIKINANGENYLCKKPIKFTSESLVQSWTPDWSVALKFSDEAILMTKLDDSFHMNPEFMNAIFDGEENEVLHFDPDFKNPVYLIVDESGMEKIFGFSGNWKKKKITKTPAVKTKGKINPFSGHIK